MLGSQPHGPKHIWVWGSKGISVHEGVELSYACAALGMVTCAAAYI